MNAFVRSTFKVREYDIWSSPGLDLVRILYEGTPPKSPTRRLLVDLYTTYGQSHWIGISKGWPAGFLQELAVCVLSKRAAPMSGAGHQMKQDGGLVYMETVEEDMS